MTSASALKAALALASLIVLAQTALAQAQQKQAPAFIQLPKDVDCSLLGTSFSAHADENGKMAVDGSVGRIECWLITKGEGHKKAVPLASNAVSHGILSTRDFGPIMIQMSSYLDTSTSDSPALRLSIHPEKVPSFKSFLQK